MPLTVLIAAAAVASSVPLLWYAAGGGGAAVPTGGFLARFKKERHSGPDMHQIALERSAGDRLLKPFIEAMASRVRRLTPRGWVRSIERKVALAGLPPRSVEKVLAVKLLIGAVATLGLLTALRSSQPLAWGAFAVLVGGVAYLAPDLSLNSRARARQEQITLDLPDVLDQMMISVEAGLGFEAALGRAGKTGSGPIAEEILRSLQEMQMGVPRRQALHNLATRTDVPDLRNFVFAVVQSEQYGLPIAQTLRIQANELRDKRRQRAEERAFKVPVKIVFPLIFCIFPSLFVVLLGPAALRMWQALFEGG